MTNGKYLMIAENLLSEVKEMKVDQEVFKAEVNDKLDDFKATLDSQVYLNSSQEAALNKAVKRRIRELLPDEADYKIQSKKMFQALWGNLKEVYQVAKYREIPRIHYESAMQYVEKWQPIRLAKPA
ncbi:ORF6C domain-containing protein [Sporomusa termitida]|uniref:ORF6C domain protein n=1 Tax=Sporomusa termitida TaxID=2377 RepID=A0A517DSA8_9FIRM|nr:ORF6C domain-containing protein [Sporomusa termitida]QDR80252.1 ORF6C domain protein [Sporomusa termitida]